MLASWVKQATATTGTGVITLGAVADGRIAFDTAFNDGDLVRYSIEDGNNREIGVGIYNSSGTTITRADVRETLVSGTYNNIAPTAISLSGSATVVISDDAGAFLPNVAFRAGLNNGGKRRDAFGPGKVNTPGASIADTLYMMPFFVPVQMEIESLGIYSVVTAGGGGAVARLGIYKQYTNGYPGDLICEGNGTIDVSTTGYNKSISLASNVVLKPGMYYIAILADDAVEYISYITNDYAHPFMPDSDSSNLMGVMAYNITPGWSAMPNLEGLNADGYDVYNRATVLWANEVNGV